MLAGVKSARYSALVTQNDDWSARVARLVAREVRRYREMQRPRMSVQKLADATAELGMPIPRSVLANLESGRRETVSVAEVLVLAAALNVAPIELICPVGFDKETEMLPGRMMEPLSAMQWFTGEWKLDIDDDGVWTMRTPGSGERSTAYLLRYHDELISRLHSQEARAREALRAVAEAVGQEADERARGAARDWMVAAEEWRAFIREPLRRTRAEMRERGMQLPDLPADIELEETPNAAPGDSGGGS
jgi:transcriptional regulator with XRE-family HTH domain